MGENDSNPSGFWEPQSIADLNDEILDSVDSEWDDVFAFQPRPYLSNFDQRYLERAVQLLGQEFGESELIVLKDPRISVLTGFWNRVLQSAGYSTHYIVMVRNPLEVAESLLTRDGFPREKSLLLWSSYMVALDRDTRDQMRTFVSFEQLMNDWRAIRDRIEADSGIPFPRDSTTAAIEIDRFLDERLHHHKATPEDLLLRSDIFEGAQTLYRILSNACEGGDVDRAAVGEIETELTKIYSIAGPVVADLRSRMRELAKDVARETAEAKTAEERAKAAFDEAVAREKDAQERLAEDIQTREHTIADLESSLRQRQEEASQGWAQVEAEREAKDALARELESHRAEAEQAVMKWKELYDREQARATSATDAIAQAQEAAARKDAEVGAALEQARVEKEAVEARLADRFREIATLSSFLAEKEAAERRFREQTDWLREAGAVLLNGSSTLKGRLLGLMPAVFQHKRQARALKRNGLFDAEAYLAAHPDVAADGADPLRHYLKHGMSEGRRRG